MRVIKFRAWNKTRKEWDYFTLDNIKTYLQTFELHLLNGDEFYLFTDLYDKNSKEIWEGDIVLNPCKEKGQITFTNGAFWMKYFPPDDWDPMCPGQLMDDKELEVIGNIYENPELLL